MTREVNEKNAKRERGRERKKERKKERERDHHEIANHSFLQGNGDDWSSGLFLLIFIAIKKKTRTEWKMLETTWKNVSFFLSCFSGKKKQFYEKTFHAILDLVCFFFLCPLTSGYFVFLSFFLSFLFSSPSSSLPQLYLCLTVHLFFVMLSRLVLMRVCLSFLLKWCMSTSCMRCFSDCHLFYHMSLCLLIHLLVHHPEGWSLICVWCSRSPFVSLTPVTLSNIMIIISFFISFRNSWSCCILWSCLLSLTCLCLLMRKCLTRSQWSHLSCLLFQEESAWLFGLKFRWLIFLQPFLCLPQFLSRAGKADKKRRQEDKKWVTSGSKFLIMPKNFFCCCFLCFLPFHDDDDHNDLSFLVSLTSFYWSCVRLASFGSSLFFSSKRVTGEKEKRRDHWQTDRQLTLYPSFDSSSQIIFPDVFDDCLLFWCMFSPSPAQ